MKQVYDSDGITLFCGDSRQPLPIEPESVDHCITSPPYFAQIDYQVANQIGLEGAVEEYIASLVAVFRNVHRCLKNGGVAWIVIGDTINNYSPIRAHKQRRKVGQWTRRRKLLSGYYEKEPLNIPQLLHDALCEDGWVGRSHLIWDKVSSSGVPNSDTAPLCHEYVLQLVKWPNKSRSYANCKPLKSSVLRHPPVKRDDHPCPYPPGLVREILASAEGNTVIDPFAGWGTSLEVAAGMGWSAIGCELSPVYCDAMVKRWSSAVKQLQLLA